MKPRLTVAASMTRAVLDSAVAAGADRGRLLRSAGIDEGALDDPEARVPRDVDRALWRAVATQRSRQFGLWLATSDAMGEALGLLGYLAMTSGTVAEALERGVRYHRIVKEGTDSRFVAEEGVVTVEETCPDPEDPGAIALGECIATSYLSLARRWSGRRIVPVEVRFQHVGRTAPQAMYEELFGCPVSFGAKSTCVVLPREAASLPLRTSQPEVARYLEGLAKRSLARLPADDVAAAVRDVVTSQLAEGDVGLPRVARALGVSPRTLQRRLEERGVEYQKLVDDIRHREALRLVTTNDTPLLEIGFLLGYSDPKAFRRAFRRWTGVSPAELRRGADRRTGTGILGDGEGDTPRRTPDAARPSATRAEAGGGSLGTRVAAGPWSI